MTNKKEDYAVNSPRWLSLEDFDGEVWRDVPNYDGLYKVSNYGRVRSLERISINYGQVIHSKILAATDNGHGYKYVCLCKNGEIKKSYIHRLVATTFIPNPLNLPVINHKDELKSNNSIDNLEWCSYEYNNKYGTARFRSYKTRRDNGNTRGIDMYNKDGVLVKHYECALDLEKDGISRRAVYGVCSGRSRSYRGCIFRFSGEPFSYRDIDKYPKWKKKEVIQTDCNGSIICIYPSIKEAERKNGLPRNYLYSATCASKRLAMINGSYFEIRKY